MVNPFQHIYQRYVDEASFLWVLRDIALNQPHYSPNDMRELEERLRRQLNGIMTAPEDAWRECEAGLEIGEAGEVFTAAVTAFRCGHVDKIQKAVDAAVKSEAGLYGLYSALDFLPGNLCHSWLTKFFNSKQRIHKRIAMEACMLRAEDPAAYLERILARQDCRADLALYQSCLQAVAQFKRNDLHAQLGSAAACKESEIQFYALRAQILLGDVSRVHALETFVMAAGEFQREAIQISFRVLPLAEARQWVSRLATTEGMERAAIEAVAALGDPQAVNWLLSKVAQAPLAKAAGEAFSTITGLNLHDEDFSQEELATATSENEEDFVELDEDEHLPYPNTDALHAWWQRNNARFSTGQRYFMGQPINDAVLREQLQKGFQRQRHHAALELALRNSAEPLKNTRAFLKNQ